MSFFETPRFPTNISYDSAGGPNYSTRVVRVKSGHEKRNQNWSYPLHQYDVAYGIKSITDLEDLISYFHVAQGRTHGFRYKDWGDFQSCGAKGTLDDEDQTIGTGDNAEVDFQLVKVYTQGAYTLSRYITKPVSGTTVIALDGVNQAAGWSVSTTTGVVTFDVAPGSTVVVSAGYQFDVPCRFDTDSLSTQLLDYRNASSQVILTEIRI